MDDQTSTPFLAGVPRSERWATLESLVVREFKRALLMTEQDALPYDANYFDLGLTSLRATEVRQRIEAELECELDTSVLFGLATVRQVIDHLASVVLPPAPDASASGTAGVPQPRTELEQQVSDLLTELYES